MCRITFNIEQPTDAVVKLVDIIGREYAVTENSYSHSGVYELDFNLPNIPPGFYFYHVYDKNKPIENNPNHFTEVATGSVAINMTKKVV